MMRNTYAGPEPDRPVTASSCDSSRTTGHSHGLRTTRRDVPYATIVFGREVAWRDRGRARADESAGVLEACCARGAYTSGASWLRWPRSACRRRWRRQSRQGFSAGATLGEQAWVDDLWLHRQEDEIRCAHDVEVRQRGANAVARADFIAARLTRVGADDLRRRGEPRGEDAFDERLGHVAGAEKADELRRGDIGADYTTGGLAGCAGALRALWRCRPVDRPRGGPFSRCLPTGLGQRFALPTSPQRRRRETLRVFSDHGERFKPALDSHGEHAADPPSPKNAKAFQSRGCGDVENTSACFPSGCGQARAPPSLRSLSTVAASLQPSEEANKEERACTKPSTPHRSRKPHRASRAAARDDARRLPSVYNLRSRRCLRVVEASLRAGAARFGVLVVQTSVQGNHIHFIVEASG